MRRMAQVTTTVRMRDHQEGDGRRVARLELLEALDVGVDRDRLRHRAGPAHGERPDDVEDAEEVEAADQDCNRHDRPDRRQHDIAEGAPGTAAPSISAASVCELVDVGKSRQQDAGT